CEQTSAIVTSVSAFEGKAFVVIEKHSRTLNPTSDFMMSVDRRRVISRTRPRGRVSEWELCRLSSEPVGMPTRELLLIGRGDNRERDAQRVRRDSETPQHVAQLLGQARLIDILPLERALPN